MQIKKQSENKKSETQIKKQNANTVFTRLSAALE